MPKNVYSEVKNTLPWQCLKISQTGTSINDENDEIPLNVEKLTTTNSHHRLQIRASSLILFVATFR